MKVVFFAQAGHEFDAAIAKHFCTGVRRVDSRRVSLCATADFKPEPMPPTIAVTVGVKGFSHDILAHFSQPPHYGVFIDKGYARIKGGLLKTLHWRVSVNAFQPHAYFLPEKRSPKRWQELGIPIVECRPRKGPIYFCGSSQKYCDWYRLGDATSYAKTVLDELATYVGTKPLVYRPKPTWDDAVEIEPYRWSRKGRLGDIIHDAACVISHGSNATLEALFCGVPVIVLGDGVAKPLAKTALADIANLRIPSVSEVTELARAIAWNQWTLDEMANGDCWKDVKRIIKLMEEPRYVDTRKPKPSVRENAR
jgi:hypothetical protein